MHSERNLNLNQVKPVKAHWERLRNRRADPVDTVRPCCTRPHSRGSLGGGILTSDGSTPQISRAYSAMVRSLENFPEAAIFLMTFLVHSFGF